MNTVTQIENRFRISTNITEFDLPYIHHYLCRDSYWASGIPIDTVKRSMDNSLCFGVFENDKQVGFARVISDMATFAYLADVFIDETYRGLGLSKLLMKTIMAYPELQHLRNWILMTKDAHGLYEQYGFTVHPQPETVMRKNNPDHYKK